MFILGSPHDTEGENVYALTEMHIVLKISFSSNNKELLVGGWGGGVKIPNGTSHLKRTEYKIIVCLVERLYYTDKM